MAYHLETTSLGVLDAGKLEGRSGNVMATINLELHHKHIDQVNIEK